MDVSFSTVIKVLCLKLYKSSVNKEQFISNWNNSGYRLKCTRAFLSIERTYNYTKTQLVLH